MITLIETGSLFAMDVEKGHRTDHVSIRLDFNETQFSLDSLLGALKMLLPEARLEKLSAEREEDRFHLIFDLALPLEELEDRVQVVRRILTALSEKRIWSPIFRLPDAISAKGAEHVGKMLIDLLLERFPWTLDDMLAKIFEDFSGAMHERFFEERGIHVPVKIALKMFGFAKRHQRNKPLFPAFFSYVHETLFGPHRSYGVVVPFPLDETKYFDKKSCIVQLRALFGRHFDSDTFYYFVRGPFAALFFELNAYDRETVRAFLAHEIPGVVRRCKKNKLPIPVYPRNPEEELRFILMMKNEVSAASDPVHAALFFSGYDSESVRFSVIIVRPAEAPFDRTAFLEHGHDIRIEKVRFLEKIRGKLFKELVQFVVNLPIDPFWQRDDDLLDVLHARSIVLRFLSTVFVQVRDFNGSLMSREKQLLDEVKREIDPKYHREFDLFFYKMFPLEKKLALEPKSLIALFFKISKIDPAK